MTLEEIADLLTLAAAYDERTPSESQARAWHHVAELERWTWPTASKVVIAHYSSGADRPRITPAAITDTIRAARSRAAASFVVPRQCDATDRDYPAWYRTQLRAHTDRLLAAWAAGEPIPDAPTAAALADPPAAVPFTPPPRPDDAPALPPGPVREASALASARPSRPARGSAGAVHFPLLPNGDPDRRAAARAELDAIRATPAPMPGDGEHATGGVQTPEDEPEAGSVAS